MFKCWLDRLKFRFWYWAYQQKRFKTTFGKVLGQLDSELVTHYKPAQGMKVTLSVTYPSIDILITRYQEAIRHVEQGEYIQKPQSSADQKVRSLDDYLTTINNMAAGLDAAIEAVQFYYPLLIQRIAEKQESERPYFQRQFYALTRDTEDFVKAVRQIIV